MLIVLAKPEHAAKARGPARDRLHIGRAGEQVDLSSLENDAGGSSTGSGTRSSLGSAPDVQNVVAHEHADRNLIADVRRGAPAT